MGGIRKKVTYFICNCELFCLKHFLLYICIQYLLCSLVSLSSPSALDWYLITSRCGCSWCLPVGSNGGACWGVSWGMNGAVEDGVGGGGGGTQREASGGLQLSSVIITTIRNDKYWVCTYVHNCWPGWKNSITLILQCNIPCEYSLSYWMLFRLLGKLSYPLYKPTLLLSSPLLPPVFPIVTSAFVASPGSYADLSSLIFLVISTIWSKSWRVVSPEWKLL